MRGCFPFLKAHAYHWRMLRSLPIRDSSPKPRHQGPGIPSAQESTSEAPRATRNFTLACMAVMRLR